MNHRVQVFEKFASLLCTHGLISSSIMYFTSFLLYMFLKNLSVLLFSLLSFLCHSIQLASYMEYRGEENRTRTQAIVALTSHLFLSLIVPFWSLSKEKFLWQESLGIWHSMQHRFPFNDWPIGATVIATSDDKRTLAISHSPGKQ